MQTIGPDFLCIGAQRSGSSWLNRNLRIHPDVWLPPMKEVHYWDIKRGKPFNRKRYINDIEQAVTRNIRALNKGDWSLRAFKWDLRYCSPYRSDQWYCSLFPRVPGTVVGEGTPAYSTLDKSTIREIHSYFPHLKLIFLMRNPISRSWSAAVHFLARARRRSIAEASEAEIVRFIHSRSCSLRSDYLRTLENWRSYYPEQQLFLGFFDEIQEHPEDLLRRIFSFLGVSDVVEAEAAAEVVNASAALDKGMPRRIARILAQKYEHPIEVLAERFGGYPRRWHEACQAMVQAEES